MKKLASLTIALLFILSVNVLSQSDESGNNKTTVGLGLDLELANFNTYPRFPPTNFVFSIKPTSSIKIEPGFGFYTDKSSTDTDGEEDNYRRLRLGLGGYWIISAKDVSPYIGLYTDYTGLNYDYDNGTVNESGYHFRIGPAVGLQYEIVENFSIGGEFLLLYKREKHTTELTDETHEHNATGWTTVSRLSFRFYF